MGLWGRIIRTANHVKNGVTDAADAIGDAAGAVADTVEEAASTVADTAEDVADTVSDSLENAADFVVDTLSGTVSEIIDHAGDAAKWLGNQAKEFAVQLLTFGLDPLVISIILGYYADLRWQARGRWKKLPEHIKKCLQPHFRINLNNIRYCEDICTGHGMAITFDNLIFFPRKNPMNNDNDVHWLIHEMAHSQQYAHEGGMIMFLHKYINEIISTVISDKTFNVHKILPLEKDADRIADELTPLVTNDPQPYSSYSNSNSFSIGRNLI